MCVTHIVGLQDNNIPVLSSSVICIHVKLVAPTPSTASTFSCKPHPPRDFPLHQWATPTEVESYHYNSEEVVWSVLEVMHGKPLVTQSYMVWEALNKKVEKDNNVVLSMVIMKIYSPLREWRAFVKMAAESNNVSQPSSEEIVKRLGNRPKCENRRYFALVNVVRSKLQKYDVISLAARTSRTRIFGFISSIF